MRIHRIIARAFGPFTNAILELAPGMTVVSGPNEAGKSSWHAATRLALTGVRRGRGRATNADAALAERHRPWDATDRWEVEARLSLDDGRTIEIHQDLAGKVACRAIDVGLGRDVSAEILDGTPDASRWLGLDRDSFAATVSVNQADIMAVADAAEQLQEQMQRAAATRGTDATAAQAIERLTEFRREAVGADTIAAKGPLRVARNRMDTAEAALSDARRRHAEYLERARVAEEAERELGRAQERLAVATAAVALVQARGAADAAGRASELAARHPVPPPALSDRDAQADLVAAAIGGWERRPAAIELTGPTSADLARQLAELPPPPDGDLQPDPELARTLRDVEGADEALAQLELEPIPHLTSVDAADAERMRGLARRLAAPLPVGALELEAQLAAARAAGASAVAPSVAPSVVLPIGAVTVLAGIGIGLVLDPIVGIGVTLLGLVLVAWGWWGGAAQRSTRRRIAGLEAAVAPYRDAEARTEADRDAAVEEARAAGWPDDAVALDALADRVIGQVHDAARAVAWQARRDALAARRDAATASLLQELRARGVTDQPDPRTAWRQYETACAIRSVQASEARRGEALRRELASREAAERTAGAVAAAIGEVETALRTAGDAIGLMGGEQTPDQIAERLRAWQRERSASLRANQVAIEEWRELTSLLAERTVAELQGEADRRTAAAQTLAAPLDQAEVERLAARADLEGILADTRERAGQVDRGAHELRGALDTLRRDLADVAEAEEAVQVAAADLQRVQDLAAVVDETLALLRAAQERVHRDLAPILAGAVQRWLPVVSGGAYSEVTVDPADLSIQVKEEPSGTWRQARLLSAGTREQIYLLLRVAMAQHLVTTGETAPLFLDEATAQADSDRRDGLLHVLHEISRERQVVLFSHDDAVARWAERNLAEPADRLIRLRPRARGEATEAGASVGSFAVERLEAGSEEIPEHLPV